MLRGPLKQIMPRIMPRGAVSYFSSRMSRYSTSAALERKAYVGAIDQGTSSTRFVIFDKKGEIVAVDQREFGQIMPQVCNLVPCLAVAKGTSSRQDCSGGICVGRPDGSSTTQPKSGRQRRNASPAPWRRSVCARVCGMANEGTRTHDLGVHVALGMHACMQPRSLMCMWMCP